MRPPNPHWARAEAAARRAPRTARAFLGDPDRRVAIGLCLGVSALGAALFLGGWQAVAISYLPAWLCLLALPAGALPVAIMFERTDAWRPQPETRLLATLRGLLALMPVAALLALPIPFALQDGTVWARGAMTATEFGAIWYSSPFLIARLALAFAIWTGLALLFCRRGSDPLGKAGRLDDGRAVLGLGLHALLTTAISFDLVVAVSEGFDASLIGLLLMASWSSLALAAAILVAPPDIGPSRRRLDRLTPLAVLLAIWTFLHFVQFLMSSTSGWANAASWYLVRDSGEGRALNLFAGLVVLLAALLALRPGETRTRLVAALALIAHVLELFWFVTPSIRGSFKISLIDCLTLIGIGGLALAVSTRTRVLFPEAEPEARTGP